MILVVGDVIDDILVRPEGALRRGTDRRAEIRRQPGGSAANQACWIAALGGRVRLAARVGAADLTRQQAIFAAAGVEAVLSGDAERPTGTIVVLVGPDGERSFLTDRGANAALNAADLPDRLLDGVRLLHLSGYAFFETEARAAVHRLAARARALGIPISVDPGSAGFLSEVGPAAFLDWSEGAAFCFPNADEAELLTGGAPSECQGGILAASYEVVVIKRGAAGAELVTRDGTCHRVAPAPVVTVDATGAGDAFLAGFLCARLAGAPLDACLARAAAAGASAVGILGGRPALGPTVTAASGGS